MGFALVFVFSFVFKHTCTVRHCFFSKTILMKSLKVSRIFINSFLYVLSLIFE